MNYELFFAPRRTRSFTEFFLLFVIQRSIATKDLGCIHFWLRCVTEILRFALDDNNKHGA